jgi:hypothetical protein
MSTLTFERPAGPRRVARPVVRRPRPQAVAVPLVDDQERALTLVREALDQTQLKTALSHAAPARYGELRALLGGLRYGPQRRALAESLAVDGLLDLGIVQLHDRARQTSIAIETGLAEPRQGAYAVHDWKAREFWGGLRRSDVLDSLCTEILDGRRMRAHDASPAEGMPSMPERAHAARYPVAPGITATADDLVSVLYGYWPHLDSERDNVPPVISGEITAWFRSMVHSLWTTNLPDYAAAQHPDADTIEAARDREIELEREALARLLEHGDSSCPYGPGRPVRHAMRLDDVARLRFIEVHLADAFGFTGYDARTRHARMDIDCANRWPR